MKKLLVLLGVTLAATLAMASPAAAHTFKCNGTFTGATFDDVVVPRDGACILIGSTVLDDVEVRRNGYFEADGTDIHDDVTAHRAVTVYIHSSSSVGDDVTTDDTLKVFVFDSSVGDDLEVEDTDEKVNICGNTVGDDVSVEDSGTDILIGDPLAACGGNRVGDDLEAEDNFTDVEFVIRGNTVADDLEVFDNKGPRQDPVPKFVQDNLGGDDLECEGNSLPFVESGNTGFEDQEGQCDSADASGASIEDDEEV